MNESVFLSYIARKKKKIYALMDFVKEQAAEPSWDQVWPSITATNINYPLKQTHTLRQSFTFHSKVDRDYEVV